MQRDKTLANEEKTFMNLTKMRSAAEFPIADVVVLLSMGQSGGGRRRRRGAP